MNKILQLSGKRFGQRKHSGGGGLTIAKEDSVELIQLNKIKSDLLEVQEFWKDKLLIEGVLVTIHYNRLVPKSKRVKKLLSGDPNKHVVGVKYNSDLTKNIITYYIGKDDLECTISNLNSTIKCFYENFGERSLKQKDFDKDEMFNDIDYKKYNLVKTIFKSYLRDSCFIEKITVEKASLNSNKENGTSIVTFYDTHNNIQDILSQLSIVVSSENIINGTSVLLNDSEKERVYSEIPYLISMSVKDFSEISPYEIFEDKDQPVIENFPDPKSEPTIGVIDTLFDKHVYFNKWVDYHDEISDDISKSPEDYEHGTAVTSLIVDGPNLNKWLDDGCGRFRVRHFGVALKRGFGSFTIIKSIEKIVKQNVDIKVWNLSLGSDREVDDNFVSLEASILDKLQNKYDVIFVVAGTNLGNSQKKDKKIGAPADSINSLVVNAVGYNDEPASYSRRGPVLSFFQKPDVSYYGGDKNKKIRVCQPSTGWAYVMGTSFAAPLIARKLSYLIEVLGFTREEAKAILIDSSARWSDDTSLSLKKGYGVVPKKINDIITVPDDEIKFVVSGISEEYNTYSYSFPIPTERIRGEDKYPFKSKVTMCYFPKCSRIQGVDYPNTELNVRFGRIKFDKNNKIKIQDIAGDKQYLENDYVNIPEKKARKAFQKWNNTKLKKEKFSSRSKATKVVNPSNPVWGIEIKTVERLHSGDGKGIRFGIVVTLKEINQDNKIEEFIQSLSAQGWLVNEISIKDKVKLYNSANLDIHFEDEGI